MKEIKLPKVAVCCPTYDGKNYCFDRWVEQYNKLSYPNKVLFVVDNSATKDNWKRICAMGIKCKYINPKNKPLKQVLAESHEMLRQLAISSEAEFFIHWEADVFKDDPDLIQNLMLSKKQVINAYYPIKTGAERELSIMIAADDNHMLGRHVKAFHLGDDCPDFIDGSVKVCFSSGLGLIMIHKSVFKKIPFRCFPDNEALPDFIFSHDLWFAGIFNYVDTSIYCRHENQELVKPDKK